MGLFFQFQAVFVYMYECTLLDFDLGDLEGAQRVGRTISLIKCLSETGPLSSPISILPQPSRKIQRCKEGKYIKCYLDFKIETEVLNIVYDRALKILIIIIIFRKVFSS